ncbi:MAG: DEAD/DEAH box helicase family protein [Chromatiaceae bacterium]|nr:DEAD/DEAH box helicase family protein [Chromatiaceae bacterium]
MPLRDLGYQARVLARLDDYFTELSAQKAKADKIITANTTETDPDLIRPVPDFPAKTWQLLRTAGKLPPSRVNIPYSPRKDGIGRDVPNIVLKVPTGGGKTYLAVSALSRIFGRYLGQSTGFVLWIVPNEAIYSQTKRQLQERQHPYRQMLDVLSGNRTLLLEKTDKLSARDVQGQLCVMLLMLPSANRQDKQTLKLFQDRGDVQGFFPPEGDQEAHQALLKRLPNLDAYTPKAGDLSLWPMVKDSLGNALRRIRPVVVLDEGHKAISELAFQTLYGFNPSVVLELTATPKDVQARGGRNTRPARPANVLVEVTGLDLDREGMIKMPLNLEPRAGTDWRATLAAALERLNRLATEASRFRAESGRAIRPILLVQAERTGSEQRDGAHIHALDVKDWLLSAGLDETEIAIKTAETNDLAQPENLDLLSTTNRVRAIITKQALQEGWDCPFAYVLCSLAASHNRSALTQLIGRILRQPQAQKTGVPALDECYVLTHHADTAAVVQDIKSGLERDGLSDLVQEIRVADDSGEKTVNGPRSVQRRPALTGTDIYLPRVLYIADDAVRPLDYEQDILFALDWSGLDLAPLIADIPDNLHAVERQMQRIRLVEPETAGGERFVAELSDATGEATAFDPAYAVRMITDLVPNPWIGRTLVGRLLDGLRERGFDKTALGEHAGYLVQELRKWLDAQRDRLAEAHFRAEVAAGRVQFRLRTDQHNWRMPQHSATYAPEGAEQLVGGDGGPLQRSLFAPVYRSELNELERQVAVYLDAEQSLAWWHRNVARQQYALQGWRRERIYPDFLFSVLPPDKAHTGNRVVVMELKGEHLSGNPDTEYKQAVLQLMTETFQAGQVDRIGELELVGGDGTRVECDLVLATEWQARLAERLNWSHSG